MMSPIAPAGTVSTAHLGDAVRPARTVGLVRRFAVLLGMVVLLGGFVGMHQMSGSPVAHGPAHDVTDPAIPTVGHLVGDAGAEEEAPSGTGHGEMEAMCLLVLVALFSLGGPALVRRLPDGVSHVARVVAPWWRLGSALRPPSLVALGISRR
ncbi:hypothetical protein EQW78_06310 [Oerskovia turbata]|uniref:Uncharacterized protein n=1 Tax=Oerskovia turbata TaxID=1713 RepID=A0A4Q1KY50_9CELL|nr:hypothetical protein EQW73_12340 [Oerskovia turbata]RXR35212.1 hypothetical protein EQW78_06310 [Oerskovia turbata]